jgi:cell division protein FtsB
MSLDERLNQTYLQFLTNEVQSLSLELIKYKAQVTVLQNSTADTAKNNATLMEQNTLQKQEINNLKNTIEKLEARKSLLTTKSRSNSTTKKKN